MTENNSYNNGQEEFELIVVDADTALFQAAKYVQEDYVVIRNKHNGEEREVKNVTTWQGRTRKGIIPEDSVLGQDMKFYGLDLSREDFEVVNKTRLKPDIENHLEEAEKQFAYFVRDIKGLGVAKDYRLCLGGEGNFRYAAATILPYKGERKEKPIVFADLKDKVFSQYKSKVIIANDCESDDTLGIMGTESQAYFRKTGKYKYLLAYLDKDIKQVWGATLFLNKKEEGVKFITPFEAAHHFAYQILKGDKTVDNILGLPDLAPETKGKYGLRKVVGCGDVAATTILEGCVEVKELFERVIECYQAFHKEVWKEPLRENALLLWMQRVPNQRFDIFTDLFDKLSINYEYKQQEETNNDN
jgi:hypothetical protein